MNPAAGRSAAQTPGRASMTALALRLRQRPRQRLRQRSWQQRQRRTLAVAPAAAAAAAASAAAWLLSDRHCEGHTACRQPPPLAPGTAIGRRHHGVPTVCPSPLRTACHVSGCICGVAALPPPLPGLQATLAPHRAMRQPSCGAALWLSHGAFRSLSATPPSTSASRRKRRHQRHQHHAPCPRLPRAGLLCCVVVI